MRFKRFFRDRSALRSKISGSRGSVSGILKFNVAGYMETIMY